MSDFLVSEIHSITARGSRSKSVPNNNEAIRPSGQSQAETWSKYIELNWVHHRILLHFGSTSPVIRMYILMLDTRNVEQTKYVLCTLKNIYSSRCSHIAVHGWTEYALEECWFIYNRNNGREMWELLLGANWQVRINRITIAWETVTWEN